MCKEIKKIAHISFIINLTSYRLYDIGRRLSLTERDSLESVAQNLKTLKALPLAAEIFKKLGDEAQVVQLHIEVRDWPEAFRLAESLPELLPTVHYQHGQWLAETDQFIEAHQGEFITFVMFI